MEISISKETERFADFLKQKDNENIIFSGAFGIGKSYFLNNFLGITYLITLSVQMSNINS